MSKNLDGENLANFGKLSISPNFSGAKVSLYTANDEKITNSKALLFSYPSMKWTLCIIMPGLRNAIALL